MSPTVIGIGIVLSFLMWCALGIKIGLWLAKKKTIEPNNSFQFEDKDWGFTVYGVIHENSEVSHRCEVWLYDDKERFTPARIRMCGGSMVHLLNAVTAEAIRRLNEAEK